MPKRQYSLNALTCCCSTVFPNVKQKSIHRSRSDNGNCKLNKKCGKVTFRTSDEIATFKRVLYYIKYDSDEEAAKRKDREKQYRIHRHLEEMARANTHNGERNLR